MLLLVGHTIVAFDRRLVLCVGCIVAEVFASIAYWMILSNWIICCGIWVVCMLGNCVECIDLLIEHFLERW